MLLKVYWFPCLVSISKSKERVVVVPRAKFTHEIDLLEAQVHRGLVHVDKPSLQRIQKTRGRFVGTGDALGTRVAVKRRRV